MVDRNLFQVTNKLGTHLLRVMVDELRHQTVPYGELGEAAQEARARYLQNEINDQVAEAVKNLAAGGFPCVVSRLAKLEVVEDGIKTHLAFTPDELHALVDAVGTNVVLVLADPQSHASAVEDLGALVSRDQAELPLATALDPEADPPSSAREEDHSADDDDDDPMFAEVEGS